MPLESRFSKLFRRLPFGGEGGRFYQPAYGQGLVILTAAPVLAPEDFGLWLGCL
jgi:hypothetical protein